MTIKNKKPVFPKQMWIYWVDRVGVFGREQYWQVSEVIPSGDGQRVGRYVLSETGTNKTVFEEDKP